MTRCRSPVPVRIIAATALTALWLLLLVARADAQVETLDPDVLTESMRSDATYYNGNQAMPCADACPFVREAERQPIADEVTSTKFQSESLQLRERTGLVQRIRNSSILRFARTAGPGAWLTVVSLGYEANRKWLKLGYKMDPAGNAQDQFSQPKLIWSDDPVVVDGASPNQGGDLVLPGDSWHFYFRWGDSDANRWGVYDEGVNCNYENFPTPQDMVVLSAPRPDSCFIEWDPYPVAVYASGESRAAYTRVLRVVDWGDWPPPDDHWDANVPDTGQTEDTFEQDQDDIVSELSDHPEDYPTLLPWLEYMLSGKANQTDPLGNGPQRPDVDFDEYVTKWKEHVTIRREFDGEYDFDPDRYWRDAAETVRRLRADPDTEDKCIRGDGAEIFWDEEREAIIIVEDDNIVTYFQPTPGRDYFENECAR